LIIFAFVRFSLPFPPFPSLPSAVHRPRFG
jgi:hypothetical protein